MLLEEKSYENILIHETSYKIFRVQKPLRIRFDKVDGITKIYNGIKYLEFLVLKYIMQFMTGLIVLLMKKMMLNILLIIILQEPELIHIIIYLYKKH